MKLLKDERGLAGVAEAGLIGLLLVVIVFAGTRVYNATRSADQANQEAIKVSETSPDFKEADTLEEEKKEEDKPKEEKKEEPKTVAVTDKPKPEETEQKKLKNISISLSASQDSTKVTLSATLGASYSGQCDFKLKKDAYKHTKSLTVNGASSCSAVFDKDDIDYDGEWLAYVYFRDNAKTVEGWADKTINVTL